MKLIQFSRCNLSAICLMFPKHILDTWKSSWASYRLAWQRRFPCFLAKQCYPFYLNDATRQSLLLSAEPACAWVRKQVVGQHRLCCPGSFPALLWAFLCQFEILPQTVSWLVVNEMWVTEIQPSHHCFYPTRLFLSSLLP